MFETSKIEYEIEKIIIKKCDLATSSLKKDLGITANFDLKTMKNANNIDKLIELLNIYNELISNYNSSNLKFDYIQTKEIKIPSISIENRFHFLLDSNLDLFLLDSSSSFNIRITFTKNCEPLGISISKGSLLLDDCIEKSNYITKQYNKNCTLIQPMIKILENLTFPNNENTLLILKGNKILDKSVLEASEMLTVETDIDLKDTFIFFQELMNEKGNKMKENIEYLDKKRTKRIQDEKVSELNRRKLKESFRNIYGK